MKELFFILRAARGFYALRKFQYNLFCLGLAGTSVIMSVTIPLVCSKDATNPRSMLFAILSVEMVIERAALGATKVPLPVTA
jgi:hypothetical protein